MTAAAGIYSATAAAAASSIPSTATTAAVGRGRCLFAGMLLPLTATATMTR